LLLDRDVIRALVIVVALEGITAASPRFDPATLGPPTRASAVGQTGLLASRWVEDAYGGYGLDVDRIPIYVLPGNEFDATYRRFGGRGGGMNVSVDGFAYQGVVFVRKGGLFGISAKTLTHELLHALSTRFTNEAQSHGNGNLIEGVTELFTRRACPPEKLPRGVRVRKSVYGAYAQFAAELAALIGIEELARCYFEKGYLALEALIDRRVGKRRFRRAARFLEADDLQGALGALGIAVR
jgi:hypothetical protein